MGSVVGRLHGFWKGWGVSKDHTEHTDELYQNFVADVTEAVKKGDLERLVELQSQAGEMKYGGIEAVSTTPPLIHLATTNDHVHIVEYLLDLGVDIDATDTSNMTALHTACKMKNHKCFMELVRRSKYIDRRDIWGRTPLLKALIYRNIKAVRVNHGADINLVTQHLYKCSGPPLYQAVNNQNLDIVKELIYLGATTQPRPQHYCSNRNLNKPWLYISGQQSSLPTLTHPNVVIMAMAELVKRGSASIDASGPGMEILMELVAAHGYPLGPCSDILVRVFMNSTPADFTKLHHKLQVCSSSLQEHLLSGVNDRPATRPQHLQQMDHHLRGLSRGPRTTPSFVMSLENHARRVARQAMMASGHNVVWATKRLQCPPALKSILLLKDIDRAYSPSKPSRILSDTNSVSTVLTDS